MNSFKFLKPLPLTSCGINTEYLRQVIYPLLNLLSNKNGKLTDDVGVPCQLGENSILAHDNTAYYHVHGQPFVYPDHADDILLTAGAGALLCIIIIISIVYS